MEDFIVPPVEELVIPVSPKKAAEQAFYAAATSSEDPVKDYTQAKGDLELTGHSPFVEMATQAWQREQDAEIKDVVGSIIVDPNIPTSEKQTILRTYALTGFIEPDLKEKYIQQTAAKQVGFTQSDIEAQDAVISTLEQRRVRQEAEARITRAKEFSASFLDAETKSSIVTSLQGTGAAIADILIAIPAGVGKVYSLLKDKDVEKANKLQEMIKDWAYEPDDTRAKQKRDAIFEFLAPLGAYNQRLYEQHKAYGLKEGLDPAKAELNAMASALVEDPLSWIGIGAIVGKRGHTTQIAEVPADSPAAVTHMANPQVAEKVGAGAVVDKTGKLAEAIGTDRGTIVHDWVLPKPLPDAEQKIRPDLVAELNRMDAEMRTAFQEFRYDPNLMDASRREQEVSAMWDVIKEQRGPYYQQANSTILETDNVFEGKAIYGRSASAGYLKEEAAIAARDKLAKALEKVPEDLRGELKVIKEGTNYYIEHRWKKEYDELAANVFGPDAIRASILGIDVSGLAATKVGSWLFPTGWAPKWVEKGASRAIARTAVLERKFVRELQEKISAVADKYGKELAVLRDEAAETGKDYFSPGEISSKFPHLSTKQVDEVFEANVYHRRLQDYSYNFFNRLERERLSGQGMQGLFDDNGNFIGPATRQVTPTELDKIKAVWNLDSDNVLEFTPQLRARQDKEIVRLDSPVITETGERLNYALVGTKHKLDILPRETLPRVPGYSPRRNTSNWYVDIVPKNLRVDGNLIEDPKALDSYARTKGADITEAGAKAMVAEFQKLYPDHNVRVRPERQDNMGQIITDYKVYNELYRHSMKRGDRLPSSDGLARLEDYLISELNSVKTLARLEAYSSFDEVFQKNFVKEYGQFLPKFEFPRLKTDIVPRQNMDRATARQFHSAQRLFDYYSRQKNFETLGDFIWKKAMYNVADALEKFKIPSDLLREVGRMGNPLMNAKKIITYAYLHLFPTRQWLVQPTQMAEIVAINPMTGLRNLKLIPMIAMDLGADAKMMKGFKPVISFLTDKMAKANAKVDDLSPTEYRQIVEAVKQSGIVQSVDMNSIIHGVFRNAEQSLVPTTWERVKAQLATWSGAGLAKRVTQLSRNVGFDAAEITNQLGIWLQTRSQWIAENPGKKWNTKENIEAISHEAWRRAGNMTRAGNLPYQEGMMSIMFQFAAIQQKLLMNLIQDTATTMTVAQRAKLTALRLSAYGVRYGIPGGALVYAFTDGSDDKELKAVMNHEVVRRGLIDYATNNIIGAVVYPDDKPDLAVTKSLSPYSEAFLPMLDVLHSTWLALDEDQVSKPRIPMLGFMSSFGKAMDDMQGWWVTKEVNEESYKMMFFEAAELASGFNAYWQGQLMLGMQDKVSRMGSKYGMEATKAEAYAKMFGGIPTQKEEDLFALTKADMKKKQHIEQMAKDIHAQLMNQRNKIGEEGYAEYGRRLNSFISLLDPKHFNDRDKLAIMEEIVKRDRYSYQTTKESVFASVWKNYSTQMTQDRQEMMDILKRSNLPGAQDLAKRLEEGTL